MSERPESVSRDISKILCLETSAEQRSVIRHTIDGFIAGDPHHRTGAIGLFAELDTTLDQPIFVLLRADSAFDPAWRDIVDSDSLFPAASTHGLHEAAEAILGRCVFPVSLIP
jgi:hypothetical protein